MIAPLRPRLWAVLSLLAAMACGGSDKHQETASGGGGGTPSGGQGGAAATAGAGGHLAGAAGQPAGAAGQPAGAAGQAGAPACAASSLCLQSSSPTRGFVNGGLYVTLKGSGFTSGARVFIGDARAPARVVDASTIVALVPPGPVGSHDVRVAQGASSATAPGAFTYLTGSVSGSWTKVPMTEGRGAYPVVTLLPDGRVLIAGGNLGTGSNSKTAEIYDPQQPAHTLPVGNTMSSERTYAAAVTLLDGRALVAGGCNDPCVGAGEVDLFDPKTNLFTPVGKLLDTSRRLVRLTLLPDGRVLITSGMNVAGVETPTTQTRNPTAEIFDPATGTITAATFTSKNAGFGRPVRLRDGRILFAGVKPDVAEILDPDTDTLTSLAGNFDHCPEFFGPMLPVLPDGRVARIAGADFLPDPKNPGLYLYEPLTSIELFDPTSNTFAPAPGSLSQKRQASAWSVMRDGSVFELGGHSSAYSSQASCDSGTDFDLTYSVEQVASDASSVTPFASLPGDSPTDVGGSAALVAITLLDGSILAAGGSRCNEKPGVQYVYFLQVPPIN